MMQNLVVSVANVRRTVEHWVRPARTSAWWDNLLVGKMVKEEWYENFRMTKPSFMILWDKLRPYLTKRDTLMREAIPIEKRVGITIYYLNDEERLRRTANLFSHRMKVIKCKLLTKTFFLSL